MSYFHHFIDNKDPWFTNAQWWSNIIALSLGIAGIFSEQLKSLFVKPCLMLDIKPVSPDSLKIPFTNNLGIAYWSYFFRIRISNEGNTDMKSIEVYAIELYEVKNKEYVKKHSYLPMRLVWANSNVVTMPVIQPHTFKFLDLGCILERNEKGTQPDQMISHFGIKDYSSVFFRLSTEVYPNTGSHILLPGKYRLKIIIAGSNLKPSVHWITISFEDKWVENEMTMLKDVVQITLK